MVEDFSGAGSYTIQSLLDLSHQLLHTSSNTVQYNFIVMSYESRKEPVRNSPIR